MPPKIIGRSIEELQNWADKCEKDGGKLQIKTGMGGYKYTDRLIVGCVGMKGIGGTIDLLDMSLVRAIRAAQKEGTVDFVKLRDLTRQRRRV